jgi:hypothetical protein
VRYVGPPFVHMLSPVLMTNTCDNADSLFLSNKCCMETARLQQHISSNISQTQSAINLSPPNISDFQFKTIGRQANFLKRLKDPDPQYQGQYQSPTPSPRIGNSNLQPDHNVVLEIRQRPTLLEAFSHSDAIMNLTDETRPAQSSHPLANADAMIDFPRTDSPPSLDLRLSVPRSVVVAQALPLHVARENSPLNQNLAEFSSGYRRSGVSVVPLDHIHAPPCQSQHPFSRVQSASVGPSVVGTSSDAILPVSGSQITSFSKSALQQLQSRLSASLSALTTVSPSSILPAVAIAPLSGPAQALHHARHTAQVAVKGADASLQTSQTMQTLAQQSLEAAQRSLELAQQSLAAAQFAHGAVEQLSAGVRLSLNGAREARERADEAVGAVGRVEAALDAQERDVAAREDRLRSVVADTRAIIEVIGMWVADLEEQRIRQKERMLEAENRRMSEERRRFEVAEKRAAEFEADKARPALQGGKGGVMDIHPTPAEGENISRRRPSPPDALVQADAYVTTESQLQQRPPDEQERLESAGIQKSPVTLAEADLMDREEILRKAQDIRRQQVMMEKQLATAAKAAKIRAERARQTSGNMDDGANKTIVPPVSSSAIPHTAPSANAPGNDNVNVPVNAGATGSSTAPMASPRFPFAPPGTHKRKSTDSTTMDPKSLGHKFIPATTMAGRLVQTDMPFSSISLASENGKNATRDLRNAIQKDKTIEKDIPTQDSGALSQTRSVASPSNALVLGSQNTAGVGSITDARPHPALQTPPPTWTVLKREPTPDISDNDAENIAVTAEARELSIGSPPPAPSRPEQASNLRHLVDTKLNLEPNLKLKREPSVTDSAVLPPRKASRAGLVVNAVPVLPITDSSSAPSQPRHVSRSPSPAVSTNSNPNHASIISVPPPRMKKFKGRVPPRAIDSANSGRAHRTGVIMDTNTIAAGNSDGSTTREVIHGRYNGRGDELDHARDGSNVHSQGTPDRSYDSRSQLEDRAQTPPSPPNMQTQSEYVRDGGYRGGMDQQRRAVARGRDRAWGTQSTRPARSPSPNASQWGAAPPRPFLRRGGNPVPEGSTGLTPVPLSPPLQLKAPRPGLRRQGDHYSPPPSPPYSRSYPPLRPAPIPSPPQIITRKRARDDDTYALHSDAPPGRRPWNEDPKNRRASAAQRQGRFESSQPFRSGRTPSPFTSLASRMQDPTSSPPADFGHDDSHRPVSSHLAMESRMVHSYPTRQREDQRSINGRNNLVNREREYERERNEAVLSDDARRETRRGSYGSDRSQMNAQAEQPVLLSRMHMGDPGGSPTRGLVTNKRGFDRGRGFGRGRGMPTRGSARLANRGKSGPSLQERIG